MTAAELLVRERLCTAGALPWSEVMHLALYDEQCGYYRYPRRIGRAGDFYTAVTVGPLYGTLLAEGIRREWRHAGQPAGWVILEQGAHDGQLAEDICRALQDTPLWQALRYYVVVEDRASYVTVQRERLEPLLKEKLAILRPEELYPRQFSAGMVVWNELADALPCERVCWTGASWQRLGVAVEQEQKLVWQEMPLPPSLLALLPEDTALLPVGYTTEVNVQMLDVARAVGDCLQSGSFFTADYGYTTEEYYDAERVNGTLRRYVRHSSDEHVLEELGEADLTAHVNFSHLQAELQRYGWLMQDFKEQGRFLTHLAEPWLKSLEGVKPNFATVGLLRQFQTLTHPTHMGRAFRCLLLRKTLVSGAV